MRQLPLLIRLKKGDIDRLPLARMEAETQIANLQQELVRLERQWQDEQEFVYQNNPTLDNIRALEGFRTLYIKRREACVALLAEAEELLAKIINELQEAFADLKRFEYVKEQEVARALQAENTQQAQALDAIGLRKEFE